MKSIRRMALIYALLAVSITTLESTYMPRPLGSMWSWAQRLAKFEQGVEDSNVLFKSQSNLVRKLIAIPIAEDFAGSQNPLHTKIQYSDKCSFPASLGRDIYRRPYEVPWIFEMQKVSGSGRTTSPESLQNPPLDANAIINIPQKIYVSPLDFRAPENYVFMPMWAMRALGIDPLDIVQVRFVRLQLSTKVVLEPLNKTWDTVFMNNNKVGHRDPTSVLELQLNKFSALSAGSVITLLIDGNEYSFLVKDTLGETGVSVYGVRVQDSDVSVDIDRTQLDKKNKSIDTDGEDSGARGEKEQISFK